ncbi:MAG TPA: FISUMP domain-containing protein [Bacteroidia bacterium]|nr:FISUMP domain-containing protein [Bacteroidia bacterium]HRS59227.1 FISUMP domain-containing protein [Bacteroidia bacterium]HRU68891.1 FISUMP domain-containing protein [Bacteroidia bacterium]
MKLKDLFLLPGIMFLFFPAHSQWQCGQNLIDSRDGQIYQTVLIGNQCWMAENLNYGTMILNISGQGGQMMKNDSVIEKYCWNNDEDYCNGTNGKTKIGGFYEFKEAMQYYDGQPAQPTQGVCPQGWHIPSYTEITALINSLGGDVSQAYTKMMPGGSSGFNALQVGYRCTLNGSFRNGAIGTDAVYYWISEQSKTNPAYAVFMVLDKGSPQVQMWEYDKSIGISVRCLKDVSGATNEIKPENLVLLYPVKRLSSLLYLSVQSPVSQRLDVKLFDLQGKEIVSSQHSLIAGKNSVNIDIPYELKGIYLIQLKTAGNCLTQKLVL